jgi:hypothetical protein
MAKYHPATSEQLKKADSLFLSAFFDSQQQFDQTPGDNLGPRAAHAFIARGLKQALEWLCWYHGMRTNDPWLRRLFEMLQDMEKVN